MAAHAIHTRLGGRCRTALLVALPTALILLGALMRLPVLLDLSRAPDRAFPEPGPDGPCRRLLGHLPSLLSGPHRSASDAVLRLPLRVPGPHRPLRLGGELCPLKRRRLFPEFHGPAARPGPGHGLGAQPNRWGQPVAFRSRAGARPLRNPELGPARDLPARHRAASLPARQGRIRRRRPRSRYLGEVLPDRRPPDRRRPPRGRRTPALGRPDRRCLHSDDTGRQPPVRAHRGRIDPRQLVLLLHLHGPAAATRNDLASPARPSSGLRGGSAVRRRPGRDRDSGPRVPATVLAAR